MCEKGGRGYLEKPYLGQDRPENIQTDQPGGDQPSVLHVHRVYIEKAATGSPRLHLHMQLLHCCGGQDKHTLRVHLQGKEQKLNHSSADRTVNPSVRVTHYINQMDNQHVNQRSVVKHPVVKRSPQTTSEFLIHPVLIYSIVYSEIPLMNAGVDSQIQAAKCGKRNKHILTIRLNN